jgi:dihydropteroate synthase
LTPSDFTTWLRRPDPRRPRRPLVMGVLNVTPDSFSDGGQFASVDAAVSQAHAQAAAGVDLIDVGGETTKPGSLPVPPEEQVRRVVPVIQRIAHLPVTISIDTTRAAVAEAALDAGASLVNDISAGRDDADLLPLVARRQVPVILMHMQGTPATMQDEPRYGDVVAEVSAFLRERLDAAVAHGIGPEDVLLDPGIGFGKTMEHNLTLLRRQRELLALGRPLVVGTSRKGFIGRITHEPVPARRLFGTAATVAWSIAQGASIVRVHDVQAMVQVVKMTSAIVGE